MADAATILVRAPATGAPAGEVPDEGRAGIEAAVARARAAQPAWEALGVRGRAAALKRFRDAFLDEPRVVTTLVAESGKPRQEAEGIELLYLAELIRFLCRAAPGALRERTRHPFLFRTKNVRVLRRPLGVVGVIGPWNFPVLNNAADAMAPLVAGNAVVLKPSEVTPLTSVLLGELWRAAGNPPDVFQVVTGRGEAGAALVDLADGVMFTGSVATGRKVAARCGERLVPCVAELGGKSPLIVLPGADLDAAARAAAFSSFIHSGQVCIRTERIYVVESVADEFERRFAERVRALRQPDPGVEEGRDLGAVTFARQLEVLDRQTKDALAKGARLIAGGTRPPRGHLREPAVLAGVTDDMEVMREETFAPLVPVRRVKDADEAVRLANASPLGLNATVFGPEAEARAVARRLESGIAIVNDVLVHYLAVEAPLGGWKASGLGVRHGVEGLLQWTRVQSLTTRRGLLAPVDALMRRHLAFPYDPRVLALLRRSTRLLYRSGGARFRKP